MIFIGYFEDISSQRGIAWRCQNSRSLARFLGYSPGESTPDHSTLSLTRERLPMEIHQFAFELILQRKRSERVERTFAHLCDTGGSQRTWLRGIQDVQNRFMSAAMAYNLGRIMRSLIGAGKPRYAAVLAERLCFVYFAMTECVNNLKTTCSTVQRLIAARLGGSPQAPGIFSGITWMCKGVFGGNVDSFGKTEDGSAGTQPSKG